MSPQPKSSPYRLIVLMYAIGSSLLLAAPIAMADKRDEPRSTEPEFFVTPSTGTGTAAPGRNIQFLCLPPRQTSWHRIPHINS